MVEAYIRLFPPEQEEDQREQCDTQNGVGWNVQVEVHRRMNEDGQQPQGTP